MEANGSRAAGSVACHDFNRLPADRSQRSTAPCLARNGRCRRLAQFAYFEYIALARRTYWFRTNRCVLFNGVPLMHFTLAIGQC